MQDPNVFGTAHGGDLAADGAIPAVGADRLTVRVASDGQAVEVTLAGELDLETTPELERQLTGLIGADGGRLLIDLRGVTFMDSTGLASIVRARQEAESGGHDLVLRRGPDQVQRLLCLTGLESRLTFEEG